MPGIEPTYITKEAARRGVIVALWLPRDRANALFDAASAEGVYPLEFSGDLHITLMYLGDQDELAPFRDQIVTTLMLFAAMTPAVSGKVSGTGRFTNDEGDGTNAFYASFDSPELGALRESLLGMRQIVPALAMPQTHGFTPHITLAYLDERTPMPPVKLPNMPIRFEGLTLAWGDDRLFFPFKFASPEQAPDMEIKAANPNAKAGEVINGRLVRGNDGKFSSGGPGPSSKKAPGISIGAKRGQMKAKPATKGGKGKGKGRKAAGKKGKAGPSAEALARKAQQEANRKKREAEKLARQDQTAQDRIKRAGARLADQARRQMDAKKKAADRTARAAEKERLRQQRAAEKKSGGGGGGGKGKAKADPAAQAAGNRATIGKALGVDLDSLAGLADGGALEGAALETLMSAGLARQGATGASLTPAGRLLLRAAERGDARGAREIMARAADMLARQEATTSRRRRPRTTTKAQTPQERAMFANMDKRGGRGGAGAGGGQRWNRVEGRRIPPKEAIATMTLAQVRENKERLSAPAKNKEQAARLYQNSDYNAALGHLDDRRRVLQSTQKTVESKSNRQELQNILYNAGVAPEPWSPSGHNDMSRQLMRSMESGQIDARRINQAIKKSEGHPNRIGEFFNILYPNNEPMHTKAQTPSDRAMFARMGARGTLRARGKDGKRDGDPLPSKGEEKPRAGTKKKDKPSDVAAMRTRAQDLSREASDLMQKQNALMAEESGLGPSWGQKLKPRYQRELDAKRANLLQQIDDIRQQRLGKQREADTLWERIRAAEPTTKATQNPPAAMVIIKQADGRARWFIRTTSAWRDKDGQWLTTKGLAQAVAYANHTGEFGPLRWWHLGTKNEVRQAAGLPPQPYIDIGDCDTSMMIGPYLYESGTFRDERWAEIIGRQTDLGVSPGFKNWDGPAAMLPGHEFNEFIIKERSLLPAAVASNHFAAPVTIIGGSHGS